MKDTKPSALLKAKAYFSMNGMMGFIILFNLCLLFNIIPQSRFYALITYIAIRILLPGGAFGIEHKGGAPWRHFSENILPFGATLRSYLNLTFETPAKEFIEQEALPDAQFIFAMFPHGCGAEYRIVMDGVMQNVMPNIIAKDNLRTLAASVLFNIPLIRELSLWTSCINASRTSAENALDKGRSLIVLPGGETEQIMTEYGKEKVYLSKRKGFIKLAMRKNVSVVPMYVFGCSDYFITSNFLYGLRYKLVKSMGICIPFSFGLLGSLCPLPKNTTIVLGTPLKFEMDGSNPTPHELDVAHALFTKELIALFDKHKKSAGYGDRQLQII
jgi:2-acylglycerol O-acyltransferase 2